MCLHTSDEPCVLFRMTQSYSSCEVSQCCLHDHYHVECSVMASKVSKEKKEHLVLSPVVEVDSVDSFLVLVLVSTKQRDG